MLKLVKYLKREWIPILIIILLLVFQAMCDLSLPDYTSTIVNVGIQQGGVQDAVPKVMRRQTKENLQIFMTANEKNMVDQNYTLLEKDHMSDQVYNDKVKAYPELANQPLYEINDGLSQQTHDQLNEVFGHAFMAVSALDSVGGDASSGSNEASKQFSAVINQITSNLPPEQQQTMAQKKPIEIIQMLPDATKFEIGSKIRGEVNQMPQLMITQSVALMVKAEYEAIGMDMNSLQMWYLVEAGLKMLLVSLSSLTAAVIVTLLACRVAAALSQELRNRLYGKVLAFSGEEMNKFSTASLITRCTNDIQQIQLLMALLFRIVFYAPIIGIGGVIRVMQTENNLMWVAALAVGVIFAVVALLFVFVMPKFKMIQKLIDKLNLVTREALTGLPVIRAFSTQKHERKRFNIANVNLTNINIFVNRAMGCMFPIMLFVMNATAILVVWVGGHGVDEGIVQVGSMMAVIQYTMQIIMAFLMLSMVSVMLPRASVSANRIEQVLKTPISIRNPEHPLPFVKEQKGVVEFDHVCFRYPDADSDILKDITFSAVPGQTTAIIGSTGSGKSTLVNLIPRFFDVTEGKLKVNGVSVKRLSLRDLRDSIGYVPQKGMLFSGNIESNISYGKRVPHEQVETAAKISQSYDFIDEKPQKFKEPIAQAGTNVSGGQRQRLSIARAIAFAPDIYIFDDSFSALDFKTDRILRKELKKVTGNATVIIVAQRISTIMKAEKIVVLDQGCVVGKGTHKELMQSCSVYREIAQSQLTKEELENE